MEDYIKSNNIEMKYFMQNTVQSMALKLKEASKEKKAEHIPIWWFINVLLVKIDDYTSQVKQGWGYSTIASEKLSSDANSLKDDIAKMKKDVDDKAGSAVLDADAKKFKKDFEQYKTDEQEFEDYYNLADKSKDPFKKYPNSNIKNILNDVKGNIQVIENTLVNGNTIGDLLKNGTTDQLTDALTTLATKDSKGNYAIDKWNDGGTTGGQCIGFKELENLLMNACPALFEDANALQKDIENMKNSITPSAAEVAKFREDMAKYNQDLQNVPASEKNTYWYKMASKNYSLITNTKVRVGSGVKTIGQILEEKDFSKDLTSGLGSLINSHRIDCWTDGYPSSGLTTVGTETDQLKTEGQRELNSFETKINTFNNVGSNCVKDSATLFSTLVRNQTAN